MKIQLKYIKDHKFTFKTSEQRLNEKAQNVGSAQEQTQNYEKNIFEKKSDNFGNMDIGIDADLQNLLDDAESTNHLYLKNVNNVDEQKVEILDITYNEYIYQSDKLINAGKKGFKEVAQIDSNISIEAEDKYNLSIKINVKKLGTYIIAKELETRLVTLTSPVSGLFKYKYDPVSQYWRSIKDAHIIDDLLIREFCFHSRGLLSLNN